MQQQMISTHDCAERVAVGPTNGGGRIHYLDIAKGILIILLVFAHFRSVLTKMSFENDYFIYVYGWNSIFTCFYMPAFFLISGYCSNFNKGIWVFITSVAKTLFLPCITLSLLSGLFLDVFFYHNEVFNSMQQRLLKGGTLWFLQALIICKLITYFMLKTTKSENTLLFVSLIMMVLGVALDHYNIGPNFFYYKNAFVAQPFLAAGLYLKHHQELFEKLCRWSLFIYPPLAVCTFFFQTALVAEIGVSLKSIPIFIAYSLFGSLFLIEICRGIKSSGWLDYWGRNSLVVYGLHVPPLFIFFKLYYNMLQPQSFLSFLFFLILLFLTVYTICYLLMKIFDYRPLKWLIGKC